MSSSLWYIVLIALAVITVFPFWMLMTSLRGSDYDLLYSTPPQIFPHNPSLAAYENVLRPAAHTPTFFMNSLIVAISVGLRRAGRGDGRVPAGRDALRRA